MATIVYQYGLRPPTTGADLVREQLRHAHDYRRALVALDTARRDELRAFDSLHGGTRVRECEQRAAGAFAAKEEAWALIKADRKRARGRSETDPMKAAALAARAAHTQAMAELRDARRAYREGMTEAVKSQRAAILERYALAGKQLYAETPTHWGTKGLVLKAHDQAIKDNPLLYDGLEPNNLKPPWWDGSGRLGVQIQGGAPPLALMGDESVHTQARILRAARVEVVVPARVVKNGPRQGTLLPARLRRENGRPDRDRRLLRLRIGSDEQRGPLWAEFPMVYDRPLPAGSVKAVVVRCESSGPIQPGYPNSNEHWTVGFSVDLAETDAVCGKGAVAIDVGWRLVPEGLRVATATGQDQHAEELVLPNAWIERLRYANDVRAIRDRAFDQVRAAVVEVRRTALAAQASGEAFDGAWFLEATEHVAQWKGAGKMVRLLRTWTDHRFDGDGLFDSFEWWGADVDRDARWRPGLAGWEHQDRHLWRLETDTRRKVLGWRKDFYRNWAARLANRYETVVFEDFDRRRVATRKDVPENETARSNRQMASTSELETVTRQAFIRRGGCGHVKVDAIDSTHECGECHHVDAFDAAEDLTHACSACGCIWDQDENSARVLLDRWLGERSGDARSPGTARSGEKCQECHGIRENRFAKLKRLKRERLLLDGTARDAVSDGAE